MQAAEIELYINANPVIAEYFNGIFHVKGNLPSYIRYPSSYIFNTGDHWVAVFIDRFQRGEYFDSYGFPPPYKIFLFLEHNCKKWTYNKLRVQSESSNFCGHYALLFLKHRSSGQENSDFTYKFTNCSDEDKDTRVNNLFLKSFGSSKIESVKRAVEKMKLLTFRMENRSFWK